MITEQRVRDLLFQEINPLRVDVSKLNDHFVKHEQEANAKKKVLFRYKFGVAYRDMPMLTVVLVIDFFLLLASFVRMVLT